MCPSDPRSAQQGIQDGRRGLGVKVGGGRLVWVLHSREPVSLQDLFQLSLHPAGLTLEQSLEITAEQHEAGRRDLAHTRMHTHMHMHTMPESGHLLTQPVYRIQRRPQQRGWGWGGWLTSSPS